MKTKIAILTIIIFTLLTSITFAADFRKASWGMSMSEVNRVEAATLEDNSVNVMLYQVRMINAQFNLMYIFADTGLAQGVYSLDDSEYTRVFDLFNKFKKLLVKKYGEPLKVKEDWMDCDNDKDKKVAVAMGMVMVTAGWRTDNCEIILEINPHEEEGSNLVLMYLQKRSGAEKALAKAEQEMEDLSGL